MSNKPETSSDPTLLPINLRRAMPTSGDAEEIEASRGKLTLKQARERVEVDRIEATQALVQLYREGRANGHVAPELRAFANWLMDHVLCSRDPAAELARLLNGKARRGAPPKAVYRDFVAAVEVAERVQGGIDTKVAFDEVAKKRGLTFDMVRNAYNKRNVHEVEVELALRRFES